MHERFIRPCISGCAAAGDDLRHYLLRKAILRLRVAASAHAAATARPSA